MPDPEKRTMTVADLRKALEFIPSDLEIVVNRDGALSHVSCSERIVVVANDDGSTEIRLAPDLGPYFLIA